MRNLSKTLVIPLTTISCLLLMVAWIAGIFDEKIAPGNETTITQKYANVIEVIKTEQRSYEPVPATIQAKQATIISSRILARIEKIHVRAGDSVKKGTLLLELEKTDLQSRHAQTQAAVNAISARLIEAKKSLERAIELTKSGMISTADLDRAQANHDALIADRISAQQADNESQAALGFSKIYAPINGRIVDRFAEPGDTAQPGIQLLSLYNPLSLRVEAHVRERLALSLKLSQQLTVIIPATKHHIPSEIEELVPAGNSGSRSFLVKSRLQYSDGLLPGMYAQLLVPTERSTRLLIPANRVAKVGQLDVIWLNQNGIAERRFIRTGKTTDDHLIEVISGLKEGDQLLPIPTQ